MVTMPNNAADAANGSNGGNGVAVVNHNDSAVPFIKPVEGSDNSGDEETV